MWGGPVTRQQLQQTINQLKIVNEIPGTSKENKLVEGEESAGRLTIAREREVTSNLAFLSSTSDDPLKVTAVCVEQRPDGEGMTIRVASNTGDLTVVRDGLRSVAKSLEQAASRRQLKAVDTSTVLGEVVNLASPRILSRLRSRHAKLQARKAGKIQLALQLNRSLLDNSFRLGGNQQRASLAAARRDAAALLSVVQRLESIADLDVQRQESQEILCQIVKLAYDFSLNHNLEVILRYSKLDPSLKIHLPEAISKLGRYFSATYELVCAARSNKWGVFRNVQVERFIAQKPSSPDEGAFRVHAEIQLLFYYEMNPGLPKPRVICSNKSACFLCNLFFEVHGKYHMPRTHGRLYEKWTLPDWLEVPQASHSGLATAVSQLHKALNESIRRCSRRRKGSLYPRESAILPLAEWPSSSGTSRVDSPADSTSTIKPQLLGAAGRTTPIGKSPLRQELPLSPPTTPPKPFAVAIDSPKSASPQAHAISCIADPVRRQMGDIAASETTQSSVSVRCEELPFYRIINLATSPLRIEVDNLHLTFDFEQVRSGHLFIAKVEDCILPPDECELVDIEQIPKASDMQMSCSNSSCKLSVVFSKRTHGMVLATFEWDAIQEK